MCDSFNENFRRCVAWAFLKQALAERKRLAKRTLIVEFERLFKQLGQLLFFFLCLGFQHGL